MPQCFQLKSTIVFTFFENFYSFYLMCFRIRERVKKNCFNLSHSHLNPFPHTTILQQTTLNIFCQNIENLHNWMDNLWQKVENIVAKGEIARFVQFLLLSLCFQKAVWEASESVYMRERVKTSIFENFQAKGELAHNEQFLLF